MKTKVWFVTGASKGLGLALVHALLHKGYQVAATSRKLNELKAAVPEGSADAFLPLEVDLLKEDSVRKAIDATRTKFGEIDVVVNNAGYGLVGGLEELSDAEARTNFDVNVFGALNVIRQALPHLRAQRSGHIFNIASIGGFTGSFAGFGIYCATKFAMHGFTESLADEIKEFGVKATVVSPGYFRTNFLESSSLAVPQHPIEAYKAVREMQTLHESDIKGNQAGDPVKAAEVLIQVAEQAESVLHLFLGPDAYGLAEKKMEQVKKDMDAVRILATATNLDK
ncbi:SDR family oxidoreductase [Parachryseolinea silvisoli]|uniref:SDR family oxidoreductase n=1 Tax=Parachryseolinea silvisoli TaxID=2873601 RepID=UPI002265E57D|nr:SDR family oxidoreductase [Parachryseolinea silvisoli]MCD9017070.1 SDR family oxidoreductase [Parachryseolinea silvisoli]